MESLRSLHREGRPPTLKVQRGRWVASLVSAYSPLGSDLLLYNARKP
jgi:hypothetical protein